MGTVRVKSFAEHNIAIYIYNIGVCTVSTVVVHLNLSVTLKEIGCDFIQGFIWGRPLLQEEAEKLVINAVKEK